MPAVTGNTKVVGVLGHPVGHTLSPLMHNAAFDALRLDFVYVAFDVQPLHLEHAVEALRALGMAGANVTIPYKVQVADYLDELDESASFLGNVNTIVNRDGRLVGYNTDGPGISGALRDSGVLVAGKRVLVVGAGGVARTVALQLASEGAARIDIAARSESSGLGLVELTRAKVSGCSVAYVPCGDLERDARLGCHPEGLVDAAQAADILVQTTQIGMHPNDDCPSSCPVDALASGKVVFELIYRPIETSLVREANRRGCLVVDGSALFLHQGALAFELWTGISAPRRVMHEVLSEALRAAPSTAAEVGSHAT